MTASGKTLQEIYDGSTTELAGIEGTQASRLKEIAQEKIEERRVGEYNAQGRIEEKSNTLDIELKEYSAECVERLKRAIDTEVKDTRDHLSQLTSDLENLAERMRKQIATLKTVHAHGLTNLRQNLSDQFEGLIENSNINLGQEEFIATKRLRNHGTTAMNSLQQKLDHNLWESRGEEKQYSSTLFKSFMQKANSIDTKFQTSMQKLGEEFQAQFKSLESRAKQAESQLNAETQGLLEKIDEHACQTEIEIQEFYRQETSEQIGRLDQGLNLVAQDLSSMHDTTTEQLNSRTQELSKSLMNASGEVREARTRRVNELNEKVDTMMAHFTQKLDKRSCESRELKTILEAEQSSIFENLKNDLTEVRLRFETRLNNLMKDGVERVKSCEHEATTEIENTYKRCWAELSADSTNARQQVEDTVVNFLTMIHESKENALKQIAQAAGNHSGDCDSGGSGSGSST